MSNKTDAEMGLEDFNLDEFSNEFAYMHFIEDHGTIIHRALTVLDTVEKLLPELEKMNGDGYLVACCWQTAQSTDMRHGIYSGASKEEALGRFILSQDDAEGGITNKSALKADGWFYLPDDTAIKQLIKAVRGEDG